MPPVLLDVADAATGYDRRPVFSGVTFELERGERLAILGPNGGGKTTLFRLLLGELPPLAGTSRRTAHSPTCHRPSGRGSTTP